MRLPVLRAVAAGGALLVATACGAFPIESPAATVTVSPSIPPATPSPTSRAPATPSPSPIATAPASDWQALVFDRPASPASIRALAVRGPVLVAVGTADGDGAVWTLERGGQWERSEETPASDDDEVFTLVDVASSSQGLVAVGIAGPPQSEPGVSAIWFSGDGIRWREVERIDGTLLATVASSGSTVVAAGGLGPAIGSPHGVAIWRSTDGGTTWSEVADTEALGAASISAIVHAEQGLVAVGYARNDPSAFDVTAAVWTSPDGVVWTRVPHSAPFDASGMRAVAIGSGAYVAVGSDHGAGRTRPSVWTSGNGSEWARQRVDAEEGAMAGVAPVDRGFAAVGYATSGDATRLALWTTPDGVTWMLEPEVSEEGTGFLHDVVSFDGRLVAVGEATNVDTGATQPIVISGPLP